MSDDQIEPQLIPKLLPHVSVIALHNSLVSDTNGGGLKDARDKDGNIIISDSTLCSLLPPQLKKISTHYKIMCVCECLLLLKLYIRNFYPGVVGT